MSMLQSMLHSLTTPSRVRHFAVAAVATALLSLTALQYAAAEQSTPLPKKEDDRSAAQKAREADWPAPDKFFTVDSLPVPDHKEAPVYPEEQKNAGIEGSVWVKVLVDRDGPVGKAMLAKESGVKAFDDAALEAALKCTYRPAWLKGKKVAIWITYEVKFKLAQPTE